MTEKLLARSSFFIFISDKEESCTENEIYSFKIPQWWHERSKSLQSEPFNWSEVLLHKTIAPNLSRYVFGLITDLS